MNYTDKEKEHIMHSFDLFCKRTIRHKAYNIHNQNKRIREHYISLEKVYNEYFCECFCFDEYPILQYHFKVLGLVFSVNDYKLGKALSKLTAKQREIILAYYFTDLNLRGISQILGVAPQSASFHHVKGLKKLRKIMEADNE